jgi:hypothetical protein
MNNQKIFFIGLCVFIFLVVILLVALSWLIYVVNQNNACQLDPNIWCYKDWKCQTPCTKEGVNPCFAQLDGLAECLFDINSNQANFCQNGTCSCVGPLQNTNNCFNQCPSDRESITDQCTTLKPS